ncbi:hypothetical protein [Nocardioides okcheonensis]|uniref:hypothetical protein n=1 Tax=Nocardioides okcheonensis TaxID=2894081 RepID=UPI001E6174FB|nr:hypothetical protein [Nocardioides okcheonensis]UFN46073.1 hypothetical protein LN652_07695 [Nocardioides okcheonensis]
MHLRSVGFEYAKWQLEQIAEHHAADGLETANPNAEARMVDLLRSLLRPNTLYPTMSVDEDGDVIAEWRIMDHGLELITTDSRAYWVLRRRGRRVTTSSSIPGLRTLLSDLTEIAEQHNPRWTALFPQANAHAR